MSNRARSYSIITSGSKSAVNTNKRTQSDIIADILRDVHTMYGPESRTPNPSKVAFSTKYCNMDTLMRNVAYTNICPKLTSSYREYENKGYIFGKNVPDKHSKVVCCNPQGISETIRLCNNHNCTYCHNEETKRTKQICLRDLFGVCTHAGSHHNLLHSCTMNDLPSFCFKSMDCGEYRIFFYHDMIRYYDKKTKATYVYEFTNRDTVDDCILNITDTLTSVARNTLMNKLRDICYIVHNIIMYSVPVPFEVCDIKDNNTYISSIPQLFGAYIYHSIQTIDRLKIFRPNNGKITGMLMEMDNIDLVSLADLDILHSQCVEATHVLQMSEFVASSE